ncbi:hypothetical protein [Microtetraspora niveoalba]|uniref:hypothetical protein n=1 Tax=Microtetraspora niveoalba TaxID=46175 RepID=UPI0012F9C1FC|nr:hypothetical protein [Microtetraspora niveoalba]
MTEKGSAQPRPEGGRARFRRDWAAAVSALAGALAAVIALVAYLSPPESRREEGAGPKVATPTVQSPSPDPDTSTPPPPPPSPSPDPETETDEDPAGDPNPSPSPEPIRHDSPSPSPERVSDAFPPQSSVPPGGCVEATTALNAYIQNAGTTRGGQAAAAQQTYLDLMGARLHAEGVVGMTISRLAAEFQELGFRLSGMTGGDPNQVIADIRTDVATFNRLCQPG